MSGIVKKYTTGISKGSQYKTLRTLKMMSYEKYTSDHRV